MSTTNAKLKSIVKASSYSDLEERKLYNEHINVVPETFRDLHLMGPKGVLIRLYKFTEHTSTKGGLVTQKYKNYTKDSGRQGVHLDDYLYQARGVVLYISPEAQKYIDENFSEESKNLFVKGATVWIHPGNGLSPANQFVYDRLHPVVEDIDFLILHPNHVEAVDTSVPVVEIEYADKVNEVEDEQLSEQDS